MYTLDLKLRAEREKLSRRFKQYRKYDITAPLALIGGYALTTLLVVTQTSLSEDFEPQSYPRLIPVLVGLLVFLILIRLSKPYKLTVEERTFLKVCSAIEDLSAYIEDGREPDKKKAEKKIDKISKKIEKWNIGRLELCKKVIGSHFESFTEAFYRKLVGAVRGSERNDHITAYFIMKSFAKFLISNAPKIETLDGMTEAMNKQINVTIPSRAKTRIRFRSLTEATLFRHIVIVTLSIIGGYTIGHISYYISHVPIEYAYTLAVSVILGINAIYWNYQRK